MRKRWTRGVKEEQGESDEKGLVVAGGTRSYQGRGSRQQLENLPVWVKMERKVEGGEEDRGEGRGS
jgi:hypothetical protein